MNWLVWVLDPPALRPVPAWLHWRDLPWPWSQLAFEMGETYLVALAALSMLAAGLLIERSFRWIFLLRTAAINLSLITLVHFLPDALPQQWWSRPIPGNPFERSFIIPIPVQFLWVPMLIFLVSAWLGCRSPRQAKASVIPTTVR